MPSNHHRLPDKEAAAAAAAEHILQSLKSAREKKQNATLAVSGGSTPKLMFQKMASADFGWENIHIFWVDERCVPPDHPDSNYGMTQKALLEPSGIPAAQIHRVQGELPPEAAAIQYEETIREFFGLSEGRLPQFDVVHLGMGNDRHTASLFPGEPLIEDRSGIASTVFAASRQSYRVTLLPGVLLNAAQTVFLVTGGDKSGTLREVWAGKFDAHERPAQLFARESPHVQWFLDDAAAAELSAPD